MPQGERGYLHNSDGETGEPLYQRMRTGGPRTGDDKRTRLDC
jgi:hypothetical protein